VSASSAKPTESAAEAHAEPAASPRHELRWRLVTGAKIAFGALCRELGAAATHTSLRYGRERRVLEEQHSRGAPLASCFRPASLALVGEPPASGPPGAQPRGFADDLGHDLLRRAVSIVSTRHQNAFGIVPLPLR